jgi:hypothetical protein
MITPPEFRKPERPISGSAIRFAPAIAGQARSAMWKVWVERDEVYALARSGGSAVHLSVHFNGQIHMRVGSEPQLLARPLPMAGGQWLHAFEWRFLLSEDAYTPPSEKLKKRDKAYLVNLRPGQVLVANLLVASTVNTNPDKMPLEFGIGAMPLWKGKLRAGYPVALVARVTDMSEENARELRYLRHELNPHANLTGEPYEPPYLEVRNYHWSKFGNIMFVVPMGKEGYRVDARK